MINNQTGDKVLFESHENIAILIINNPPVNALSKHVRLELASHLKRAESDQNIDAVIICGAGKNLCGGADIR